MIEIEKKIFLFSTKRTKSSYESETAFLLHVLHVNYFWTLVLVRCHLPVSLLLSQLYQNSLIFPGGTEGRCGSGFLWEWMLGIKISNNIISTSSLNGLKGSLLVKAPCLSLFQSWGSAWAIFGLVFSCRWPAAGFHTPLPLLITAHCSFCQYDFSFQGDTQEVLRLPSSARWML